MSPRSFLTFATVTTFLVLGAVFAIVSRPAPVEIPKDRPLVFAGLETKINEVSELQIKTSARSFTIVRSESGWGLKELNNFPVLFDKLKTVVVQLAQLRYLEPKTSDPKRYGRLELQDPKEKGAKSKQVRVLTKGGVTLAKGIVGKKNEDLFGNGRSGTYMRFGDDKKTWLVEGGLDLGEGPSDWTLKTILDIKRESIKRLQIGSPRGGSVVIQRQKADQKDFKFEKIPAGKSQRGQWETNDMATLLDKLELKDIRLVKDMPRKDQAYTGQIFTFDGLIIKTRAVKSGKKYWVSLNAEAIKGASKSAVDRAKDISSALSPYAFEIDEKPGKKLTCEHINLLEGAGINACA
jgi:hypothetical protein